MLQQIDAWPTVDTGSHSADPPEWTKADGTSSDNSARLIHMIEVAGPAQECDEVDDVVHPDVALPGHLPGSGQSGREALKQGLRGYCDAYVGETTIVDEFTEGDMVALRMVTKATHTGEFLGIPATGRQFEAEEIMIAEFRDRQVVRFERVANLFGVIQTLGGPLR